MAALGFAVYAACVDFMLHAARLFGVTYRDANAGMFFLLWPVVTVLLIALVAVQAVVLRRARTAALHARAQARAAALRARAAVTSASSGSTPAS